MPGLLIDRKVLIQNKKLYNLLNLTGSPPKTKDDIGIVFLIPKNEYDFLYKAETVDEKISYISSKSFIKRIYKFYFVIYNENKKICEIRDEINNYEHLCDIIDSLIVYLPEDVTIWAGIVDIELSDNYIKVGFDNPHISDESPLNYKFSSSGLAFSKTNNITKKIDKIIFELSPDPKSVKSGDTEEVDAVWSRYNFHTHPKKAYENHGVVRGWPSSQDFVGFLSLENQTIFHTVVTLEGIYVISLSPEWKGKLNDINKKYIRKHYDIDHLTNITFDQYINDINAKKYKGQQLFEVKFLDWNKATDIFPVYFSKTKNKCLATEEMFKIYNQL